MTQKAPLYGNYRAIDELGAPLAYLFPRALAAGRIPPRPA